MSSYIKFHKIFIALWLCMLPSFCMYAQNDSIKGDQRPTRYTWKEKWYFQVQGGLNYMAAENTRFVDFSKVLSSSYTLSVGKRFTPIWGAEVMFSTGEEEGVYYERQKDSPMFSFNHWSLIGEGTFNFANFFRRNKYVGNEKKWNADFNLGFGWIRTGSYDLSDEVKENPADFNPKTRDNFAFYGGIELSYELFKNFDISLEPSVFVAHDKYNSMVCSDHSSEMREDVLAQVLIGLRYTLPAKKRVQQTTFISQQIAPVVVPAIKEPQLEEVDMDTLQVDPNCHEIDELLAMAERGESIRGKKICDIEMVHFDFDKSIIKPEFAAYLDKLSTLMLKQPDVRVLIMGHTDFKGSVDYNYGLSERRSEAVLAYLHDKGITYNRMIYKYYSKLKPFTQNKSDYGRSVNRRVQFLILP